MVDDSHLNRRLMSQMLTTDGHECLLAEDGLAAIALVAGHATTDESRNKGGNVDRNIDVILMDNNMPRMTGPVAVQEIRRRGYKGVILGVSGDAQSTEEFALAGANDTLVKPITKEGLLWAIFLHLTADLV